MACKPTYEEMEKRAVELAKETTRLKQLEEALRESEEKYATLVENSLTGIYIDQDEKIVFANERFARIYGYSKEEITGIRSWELVHPEDRELTNRVRAGRLRGDHVPAEYEARGLTRRGETIWVKRRNARIEYKGRSAILGNVVDITERKRAEADLRKRNEDLRDFVRVVSHDLKTPVISIQGFSSRLSAAYPDQLGDKGRDYLERIRASARRMELLVSDLETLLRIGVVPSTFESIAVLEIVRDAASDLHDSLAKKGVELVVAPNLPTIYGDRNRIYQVFENLLVNAVSFMGSTKTPRIELGYRDQGEFHEFCVKDNGIGIDPKYHRKVFQMFQRLKEIKDVEGTGLGLAIVERIVGSQGGKVWVESEKGKGATFCFTLPKTPEPGGQVSAAPDSLSPSRQAEKRPGE